MRTESYDRSTDSSFAISLTFHCACRPCRPHGQLCVMASGEAFTTAVGVCVRCVCPTYRDLLWLGKSERLRHKASLTP